MKLRLFTAVTAMCLTIVACDSAPKEEEVSSDVNIESETTSPAESKQGEEAFAPASNYKSANVTDEELMQLADLSDQFQQISQEAQMEMMVAVEEAGLQVERYTEIQQMSQNPNAEPLVSEEEILQFEQANISIDEIQSKIESKMIKILEDAGLSEQWYQNVTRELKEDGGLLSRYQQIMQERMQQQGPPQ